MKFLLPLLAMVFALSNEAAFATEKAKVLRVRARGEPASLDWNLAYTSLDGLFISNIMEGLISPSPELKPTPSLATHWDVSADQKTYTFHLKPDVRWSDGVLLKAQDFVDSWNRLLSPTNSAR